MEKKSKRVSDVIGDGKIVFYPDYPQKDIEKMSCSWMYAL
ncbi:hypothetical protein ES703_106150 [subsurface metagenome]